jgi:hypothetical protein
VPSRKTCLAPSKRLDASFKRTAIKGAKPALRFVSALAYLDKGIKHTRKVKGHSKVTYSPNATLTKASDSFSLSLKGLSKGAHTLKIVVQYTKTVKDKKTTRTETVTKTISAKVEVC